MYAESHTYKSVGEHTLRADVFRASGAARGPAILWLHGGALIFGDRSSLPQEQAALYVRAGYTVVAVDYRLAPETKLPAIADDLRDAYQWLRTSGPALWGIDPARVAVVGHSAGAYLALMAGFCLAPRPRALVSFYGYGDIAAPWYTRPDPHYCQYPAVSREEALRAVSSSAEGEGPWAERFRFYLYCRQQGRWPVEVTGHDPDLEPDWFDAYCPVRNVTGGYPPALLLHGDRDTDVPVEQSIQMADQLRQHAVPHKLVLIPGGAHGFDAQNGGLEDLVNRRVLDRVLGFLEEHCG